MATLDKHPQALVYPAIDILTSDGFIQSDNVVGAFDWGLNFVWESLDKKRIPLLSTTDDADTPLASPAAPGILSVNTKFYNDVGGFEPGLRLWGQDSIELSIRTWLCGGEIIKQPCSRVAQKYKHLFSDSIVNSGITQGVVDYNVMSIAERYMRSRDRSTDYKETVFQARFAGRVPYSVEVPQSERFSKHMSKVALLASGSCSNFDWYLTEIYPGLLSDREKVKETYQAQLSSSPSLLTKALQPLIAQYLKKDSDIDVNPVEIARLDASAHTNDEMNIQRHHDSLIPRKVRYEQPQDIMDRYADMRKNSVVVEVPKETPIPIPLGLTIETDAHEIHANVVRKTLACEDEVDGTSDMTCATRTSNGGCTHNKEYMYFGCPKSCGLCGTDSKICFDFYEKKCIEWAAAGRCKEQNMLNTCRRSCNFCTPLHVEPIHAVDVIPPILPGEKEDTQPPAIVNVNANPIIVAAANVVPDAPPIAPIVKAVNVAPIEPPITQLQPPKEENHVLQSNVGGGIVVVQNIKPDQKDEGIDPYTTQKQYAAGQLADPGSTEQESSTNCDLNGKSNGELLSRITLHTKEDIDKAKGRHFRIFCSIYTMENKHTSNVQATKETWAKRCDGFIAMSTKTDPTIPSLAIEHEGDESYDNMWQKSRSIWKYIASKYINDFDFFLIGGDDMFYIIENLRYYLGTDPTVSKGFDEGKGLFVGRRFYPPGQNVFNSGGAGYLLDKMALKSLAEHIDNPPCAPHQRGFWEDVNVAQCLREAGKIMPIDTRDSFERERFHPFQPGNQLTYRINKDPAKQDWYPKYNPWLKEGFECCSADSISFHYSPALDMKKMYRYVYHCANKEQTSLYGLV